MSRKNSKKAMNIDEISYEYEVEENGFDEEIVGTPVASFSFNSISMGNNFLPVSQFSNSNDRNSNSKPTLTNTDTNTNGNSNSNTLSSSNDNASQRPTANNHNSSLSSKTTNPQKDTLDHRVGKTTPNGITPPIDGEYFDIKRTYPLRKSTVRKLNELKAAHPDVNAYLSTILDSAIVHYYNYIFLQGGSQK